MDAVIPVKMSSKELIDFLMDEGFEKNLKELEEFEGMIKHYEACISTPCKISNNNIASTYYSIQALIEKN